MESLRDANQSGDALWDYDGLDRWPWEDYRMRYSPEVTVLFCIAYSAVFVVGFVGNISVVLVVYKNVRMQSSPTNIFIVNLAIADLLVIVVCVPFTLIGSITTGTGERDKTKMCTNDIASKLNHWKISLNPHQIENNRRELVRQHFEKLSELFAGNVPVDFAVVDRNLNQLLADATAEVDRRSVDLRGVENLAELFSFLRKNVNELKTVFKKNRRKSVGYYTESELADIEPELRSLDEDVRRLMDALNDISGNRGEIKHLLKMYTEYENQYVRLRSLNKSARHRYRASKTENDTNDTEFNLEVCNRICKWAQGCPCNTAQDLNVRQWRLGLVICKLVPYFQGVSVNASINTLMAISVERCLSICYPMKPVGKGVCKRVVAIIWIVSLTITLPWAIYFDLQPMEEGSDNQICLELWPTAESGNLYFVLANLLLCYVLPLTVIAVCYMLIWQKVSRRKVPGEPMHNGANMVQRSKMKVITMIMYVVVLFAVSWLPLYVAFSLIKFWQLPPAVESYTVASLPVAQWLGAANSSINPLLYAIFNHRFRDGYRALLSGKICKAFDYSNSVSYLRGGRAGTAAAFKRNRNDNNNDNGRCDRNNRNTIGAIYVHAARSQLQQQTAHQPHRPPVQPQPQPQRPATQQLQLPANRIVKSSSVRETHVAERSAGSLTQFRLTKSENSFV